LVVDSQSTTSQHKSPPVHHAARRASFVFADFLWRLNKKSGAARGRNPAVLTLLCAPKNLLPVFTRPETVSILLDSLRFLRQENLKIYASVVLENNCHFVLQSGALDRDVARYKSWTAKRLIQYLVEHNIRQILAQLAFYKKAHKDDRVHQFWQEGVHPALFLCAGLYGRTGDVGGLSPMVGAVCIPTQERGNEAAAAQSKCRNFRQLACT